MNRWMLRFIRVTDAFQELKSMTKKVPAAFWAPEYRELAEKIHSMGRDYFHAGLLEELTEFGIVPMSEKTQQAIADPKLFDVQHEDQTPLEHAYRTISKLLAVFPNCLLCGRGMPGHHAPDCEYLLIYDETLKERGQL